MQSTDVKPVYTTDGVTCSCGAPLVKLLDGISQTCVGYSSPPGHSHDDNCITGYAICDNDHIVGISIRRTCPECDWKGKESCWCHPGKKLDKWPDLPLL